MTAKLSDRGFQELVERAAIKMIYNHLECSDSVYTKPSRDKDYKVYNWIFQTYSEELYTLEEFGEISFAEHDRFKMEVKDIFNRAAKIADSRWKAAKTLMGIF